MNWLSSWLWSLPLIVVTVVIHACGLAAIAELVRSRTAPTPVDHRHTFTRRFIGIMAITVLLVTMLHGIDGAIWALAFRLAGALPDDKSAMLYSIGAMTSYGHASLFLEKQWQMMGALEALNGIMLFGITTAFMFAVIQRLWPVGASSRSGDGDRSGDHSPKIS